MKRIILTAVLLSTVSTALAELSVTGTPGAGDLILWDGTNAAGLLVGTNDNPAVRRAAGDLASDFSSVTGIKPEIVNESSAGKNIRVIIGTLGAGGMVDALAAGGKLEVSGVHGEWESYVLQVVKNPLPGVDAALVIAGSDRRGTIYGIYTLSEMIGVSPWHWWADVPVAQKKMFALHGDGLKQGPPAVKYRGIFLNDEDWCLRPWAAKTFEPETGNIGPKTYAKIFELLLRLHANYLWPAMHPGTKAFNFYPTNKFIADDYGIVMGSSHCEQMLRDNVDEWDAKQFGDYNYVTNPDGVRKYWEQRVAENGKFESLWTLGMRGIHDGAMPGGGTEREKAARLHQIISDQRDMLARDVNTNLAQVPQIFCPYKEVLPLYRLMPDIPEDITLVWPDDNYGYIRQFSNVRERARSGGAGVYYHVSYWGGPRDYLWLCTTPPALIAEEMTKAFDYGADKVWILNVGDLKPAELDMEFFLKLAWNPHAWNGTNTYDLLEQQIGRDFGAANAAQITGVMANYYGLNFERKPEHMGFPAGDLFTGAEVGQRMTQWQNLSQYADTMEKQLPPEVRDTFFELVGYPVKAAGLQNKKFLAPETAQADEQEIQRLTDIYNNQIAGGKWHGMMSDNPHGLQDFKPAQAAPTNSTDVWKSVEPEKYVADGIFAEKDGRVMMEAEHASAFVPGRDASWQKITGLGYNGGAVTVFPTTVAVRSTPAKILAESPCMEYKIYFQDAGDWKFTVRALPTFSFETGKPQRYAIALDDAPPQIVSMPFSTSENDKRWQENVLRNAALTSSVHQITNPGLHVLKIWMVDPGIVLDAIAAENGTGQDLGYVWPPETRGIPSIRQP